MNARSSVVCRRRRVARAAATALALAGAAGAIALAPSGTVGAARATAPLSVVAGENPWGSVAAQVGGTEVSVVSILNNPNTDPHLYESDARDAAEVARARLLVENGLGYDDFMGRLAGASPNARRATLVAATIVHARGADANPHLWYGIENVRAVAAAIAKRLSAIDPAHRRAFDRNLARFDAALRPWQSAIDTLRRDDRGAPIAYTERVPGYLVADAQLSNRTPTAFASAVEDGTEPSPQATAAMQALISGHKIRALLYNVQATAAATSEVRALAEHDKVPVVAVSETLPKSDTTIEQWQTAQALALVRALRS